MNSPLSWLSFTNSLVSAAVARRSAHELSQDQVVNEWCIAHFLMIVVEVIRHFRLKSNYQLMMVLVSNHSLLQIEPYLYIPWYLCVWRPDMRSSSFCGKSPVFTAANWFDSASLRACTAIDCEENRHSVVRGQVCVYMRACAYQMRIQIHYYPSPLPRTHIRTHAHTPARTMLVYNLVLTNHPGMTPGSEFFNKRFLRPKERRGGDHDECVLVQAISFTHHRTKRWSWKT